MNYATKMDERIRLDGQVAVVTGSGRGIGRAAALTLARAGASLVVTARTDAEIKETAEQIRQAGGKALASPGDVSDWAGMERLAQETALTFGPADVVVVNAGVLDPVGDTWQVEPEAWADNLSVNLVGAFNTARAFLPAMTSRQRGVLIFVSSGAASHSVPGWSAYCAAKAGLDHLARNLADELDQAGLPIRVHTLYPGIVSTAMQAHIRQLSQSQFAGVDRFRTYHQTGQLRPPEEPAALIWWLATPLAAEFHGQIVSLDDPAIRQRLADDLGLPVFSGREA